MASGAEDGSVALWDLDTMACARTCTHMDGGVKTVSISHDSQYVAYAGEQDYLVMESIQGGNLIASYLKKVNHSPVCCMTLEHVTMLDSAHCRSLKL